MAAALFYFGNVADEHGMIQLQGRQVSGDLREGMHTLVDHERIVINLVEKQGEMTVITISTSGTMIWLQSLAGREIEFIDDNVAPVSSMQLGTETA